MKIGVSTLGGLEDRIGGIQTGNPWCLDLLAVRFGDYAMERTLHRKFSKDRMKGEWFASSPELEDELAIAIATYVQPERLFRKAASESTLRSLERYNAEVFAAKSRRITSKQEGAETTE